MSRIVRLPAIVRRHSGLGRKPRLSTLAAACLLAAVPLADAAPPKPSARAAEVAPAALPAQQGRTRVIVQFTEAPVSRMRPDFDVSRADRGEMQSYRQQLLTAKAPRLAAIARLGGRVVNTVEFALNGAVVEVDARRMAQIARIPGVKSVRPAGVYQLSATAPRTVGELIGTAQLAASGITGQGTAIAIIDSGVDYTHASFNGPGTTAYYASAVAGAAPTVIGDTPGVFPSGPQVLGGYDWLGETWNGAAASPGGLDVTPDPDPIDNRQAVTDFAGHGTNSASAAAGQRVAAGGIQAGSAPGAFLLAYRACSRLSSACEGSALLNSVDSVIRYAAGLPNEGQPGADNPPLPPGTRVVINMSLGASGGNPLIDDLSEASRNAVRAGIMVVASAGNSGDTPFISGTPGSTDMVLSVAASEPEGVTLPALSVAGTSYLLTPPAAGFGGPLLAQVTLPLAFAGTSTTTNPACIPQRPLPSLTGAAGIADRGDCAFIEKAASIQQAGATLGVIVNNQPGSITMSGSDPAVTIPFFSMLQESGTAVKTALAADPSLQGTFSPADPQTPVPNTLPSGVNAVDLISSFSSRGLSQDGLALKPDITAPGTNIFMAAIGSGDRGVNSSGTSFSSPLTAGAAALVLSARPELRPWEVKAALMNTANPEVFATKSPAGNTLVPLARMGAGRVEAERAAQTGTLAYSAQDVDPTPGRYLNTAVSFGVLDFTEPGPTTVSRTIRVRNLDNQAKTYDISVAPRFADDAAKGVVFSTSVSQLSVPPRSTRSFELVANVTGSALPTVLDAGLGLPFPARLNQNDTCTTPAVCAAKFTDLEQDGFVVIDGGPDNRVTVPYLAVPRQASDVRVTRGLGAASWQNTGVGNTRVEVFNLVGVPDQRDVSATVPGSEEQRIDIRAVGLRYTPDAVSPPSGVPNGDLMEIAVALNYPVPTLRQAVLNVEIDVNEDGAADYTVRNLTTTTGVQAVFISAEPGGAPGGAFFIVNTPLDSKKVVLPVFPSLMGIAADSRIGIRTTSSTFFGSPAVDTAPSSGEFQYLKLDSLVVQPSARAVVAESGASGDITYVLANENQTVSPGDKGLLLFHGDNPVASEFTVLRVVR